MVVHRIDIGRQPGSRDSCYFETSWVSKGLQDSRWPCCNSKEIGIAQGIDLIGSQLIWLGTKRNLNNLDSHFVDESGGDHGARSAAGRVTVEHDGDVLKMFS